MTTIEIGPSDGTLTLHTGVEGRAAKAGHALTIAVRDWSGTATMDAGAPTAFELTAEVASLEVVSGEGGLKPLSDKDRRTVKDSALETLGATKHPQVRFRSTSVHPSADGYDVSGELSLHGATQPSAVRLTVAAADGRAHVEATVPVVQSEFGVKPYTGLMGGLRVRDRVDVRLDATVTDPRTS